MRRIAAFCFLFCIWALLPDVLWAQTGQVDLKYIHDKTVYSCKLDYEILEADDIEASRNHHFSFTKPREITVKFKQLHWLGRTPVSSNEMEVSAYPDDATMSPIHFGENEEIYFIFSLKNAKTQRIRINFFVGFQSFREPAGDLTLTFNRKSLPPPPSTTKPITETSSPTTSPPSSNVQRQEDKDWATARNTDSPDSYQVYIKQYGEQGKHYKEASQRLASLGEMSINEDGKETAGDTVWITVRNLTKAPKIEDAAGVEILEQRFDKNEFEHKLTLLLLNQTDTASIRICDSENPSRKKKPCITHTLGNRLSIAMFWSNEDKEDTLSFVLSGGTPPYSLYFKLDNLDRYSISDVPEQDTFRLSWAELKRDLIPGVYTVEARDAGGHVYTEAREPALRVKDGIPQVLRWTGIVLLLFAIILTIRSILARNNRRRSSEARRQVQENIAGKLADPEYAPSPEPLVREEAGNREEAKDNLATINIRPRASSEQSRENAFNPAAFQAGIQADGSALPLQMGHLWQDSVLKVIYLRRECILEIDHFLRAENTTKIKEHEKDIPEIGGMLMGRVIKHGEHHYEASVAKFVPISAKYSSVYELEFDVNSFAVDLTSIQDQFPDLVLVGWFHTHPGHGLFLSPPDLRIHQHFSKPYQFAMEIDSLTENLDTAFFCRRSDQTINNAEHLRPGAKWFAWTEIEKFTRKRT